MTFLKVRWKLGAINADPKNWYKDILKDLQTVTLPRRATSLYTEHLMGSYRLHPSLGMLTSH